MSDPAPGLDAAGAAGPCRILLLAALSQEVRPFLRRSRARRRRGLPWPAWEFALNRVRGLVALTGMGPVAAREAAVRLTAQFRPNLLISVGFGGALNRGLKPGTWFWGNLSTGMIRRRKYSTRWRPRRRPTPG